MLNFMADHHELLLSPGRVLHCMVITPANKAYDSFHQSKFNDTDVGAYHGCLVKAAVIATPSMVLRLEFDDISAVHFEKVKMTAVHVNGDMSTPVKIDIDEKQYSSFKSRNEGIMYDYE